MISLRPATDKDISFVFNLRNIPEVYEGFYQQKAPLQWEEHCKWWYSRPSSWKRFIIELDGVSIGILNIGQTEHWSPEIGYCVHPDYWNKGYGKEAVKQAIQYLKDSGFKHCHTTIKWDNERSMRLAWSLGFQMVCQARDGEAWLTKDLTVDFLL